MSDIPQFPLAEVKVRICDPGTRHVEVPRIVSTDRVVADWRDATAPTMHIDVIRLTPHMRGTTRIFAGYHAASETWFYTDD